MGWAQPWYPAGQGWGGGDGAASSPSPWRGGTCPLPAHPADPSLAHAWEHFPDASVSLKVKKMSGKAHVMGA